MHQSTIAPPSSRGRKGLFSSPEEVLENARPIIGRWHIEGMRNCGPSLIRELSIILTAQKSFCPNSRYLYKLLRGEIGRTPEERQSFQEVAHLIVSALDLLKVPFTHSFNTQL